MLTNKPTLDDLVAFLILVALIATLVFLPVVALIATLIFLPAFL